MQYSLSHNVNFATRIQNKSITATDNIKGKSKAVPLQAWSGPEGSRKLRFPDFMTTAQDSQTDVHHSVLRVF